MELNSLQHVKAIKERYDAFERFLLQNGQLLAKETKHGFWGVSHIETLHELFQQIELQKHAHLLDLGSGDGRVCIVASLFGVKATGIECDDWLTNTALDMKRKLGIQTGESVTFLNKNFMNHTIRTYDIIYVSPDKPFHRGLEQKLKKELNGKLIVHGYEFHPKSLSLEKELMIHGEKFQIYI